MERVSSIIPPHAATREVVGAKGMNLLRLSRFGQPVPAWFALHPRAMKDTLQHSLRTGDVAAQVDRIRRDPYAAADVSRTIHRIFAAAKLPDELRYEIDEARRTLLDTKGFVAVRSSAIAQQGAEHIFAGLHDSVLYLRDANEIIDAIKRVWASAYCEAALAYRQSQDMDLDRIQLSVIVQTMVEARSSGVMHTVNPETQHLEQLVLRSLWGTGEGIMGAGLEADRFLVDKTNFEVEADVAAKSQQMTLNSAAGFGLMRAPVPDHQRAKRSLSQEEVRHLAEIGIAIEQACGRPQEIEFVIDPQGQIAIVQTRSITTLEEYGPAAGNKLLWERRSAVEYAAGVTTPLTYSFLKRAANITYLHAAQVLGVPYDLLRERQHLFSNLLGLIRGRLHLGLPSWFGLLELLPSSPHKQASLQLMLGVHADPERLTPPASPSSLATRLFAELPRDLRFRAELAWKAAGLRRSVPAFLSDLDACLTRWRSTELDGLRPHELMALYRDVEAKALWQWSIPVLNEVHVMLAFGRLQGMCRDWTGEPNSSLYNDLLCGIGGLESTEPARLILELAETASANDPLKQQLLSRSPEDLAANPPDPQRFAGFADQFAEFLTRFGDLSLHGLKLEQPCLREQPAFIFQVLQNVLSAESRPNFEGLKDREAQIRQQAESVLSKTVSLLRRPLLNRVIAQTRRGVRDRENLYLARARVSGLVRDIVLALGRTFESEDILPSVECIFYLTLDEIWDYIKGTAVSADLGTLVKARRAEFEQYAQGDAADRRFATFGMVYHRNHGRAPAVDDSSDTDQLHGTGACPGRVEATVRLVSDVNPVMPLNGEVLVTRNTEPGWGPLLLSASGLLVEEGSLLSHAVVVARELGVPTIVGLPGLMSRLKDGDRVRLDAAHGLVELIHDEEEDAEPAAPAEPDPISVLDPNPDTPAS